MNWLKKPAIFRVLCTALLWSTLGCGVKGDPLPPEKPPMLGRGRPTYKRATEEIKIEKTQRPDDSDEDDDDSKE